MKSYVCTKLQMTFNLFFNKKTDSTLQYSKTVKNLLCQIIVNKMEPVPLKLSFLLQFFFTLLKSILEERKLQDSKKYKH